MFVRPRGVDGVGENITTTVEGRERYAVNVRYQRGYRSDLDRLGRVLVPSMTVGVMFMGLLPIMWSTGTGADVMKRIAAPMIGGIFTSFVMELVVYPAIYAIWKWRWEVKPALQRS